MKVGGLVTQKWILGTGSHAGESNPKCRKTSRLVKYYNLARYIPKPLLVGGSNIRSSWKARIGFRRPKKYLRLRPLGVQRELVLLEGKIEEWNMLSSKNYGLCFFVACRTWFKDICKLKDMAYLWWKVIHVIHILYNTCMIYNILTTENETIQCTSPGLLSLNLQTGSRSL